MKKIDVAIIEPSPVFGNGFRAIVEMYSSEFCVAGVFRDISSFRSSRYKDIDVIVLNPSLITFQHDLNVRDEFSNYKDIILIATPYGYVNPSSLFYFDGVLNIYDDGKELVRQLVKIVNEFKAMLEKSRGNTRFISKREKDIIIGIAHGKTNNEIANELCLSPHTVMSYRKKLSSKIGRKGTAGFTSYAIINNLVSG